METLQPLIKDEDIEFPTWFWSDVEGSSAFWHIENIKLPPFSKFDSSIFDLSKFGDHELPVYFYADKTITEMSWLLEYKNEKLKSAETSRTWLTRKENDELGLE